MVRRERRSKTNKCNIFSMGQCLVVRAKRPHDSWSSPILALVEWMNVRIVMSSRNDVSTKDFAVVAILAMQKCTRSAGSLHVAAAGTEFFVMNEHFAFIWNMHSIIQSIFCWPLTRFSDWHGECKRFCSPSSCFFFFFCYLGCNRNVCSTWKLLLSADGEYYNRALYH